MNFIAALAYDPELATKLKSWEGYYNKQRSHSSLGGKNIGN